MKRFLLLAIIFTCLLSACADQIIEPKKIEVSPTLEVDLEYVIEGDDVHIQDDKVTLKDMVIEGDLYIDESVGDGEFRLENVEVTGTIYVNGGGENSGYFINARGKDLIISSETNPYLVLSMNSSLEGISVATDCGITTDSEGIEHVKINNSKTQEAVNVLLTGNYPDVSIESTANVMIDGTVSLMTVLKEAEMTSIDMVDTSKVYFYSCNGQSVTVLGGIIVEAWINAECCSLPENVENKK